MFTRSNIYKKDPEWIETQSFWFQTSRAQILCWMTDQIIHGRRCSYLNGWSSLGWEHKRNEGFRKSFIKKFIFPWFQRMSGILTDKEVSGVENCLNKDRGQEKTPWHVWETAKGDSPLNPCIPVGTVSPHRSKVSAAGVKKILFF